MVQQQQMVQQQVNHGDLNALGTMVIDGVRVELSKMSDEFTDHIVEIKQKLADNDKVQAQTKKDINSLTLDVTRLTTELADVKRSLTGAKWAAQLLKGEVHGVAKRVLEHDRHLACRAQISMHRKLRRADESPGGTRRMSRVFDDDDEEDPPGSDGPTDEEEDVSAINKVLKDLSDGEAHVQAPAPSPALLPQRELQPQKEQGRRSRGR